MLTTYVEPYHRPSRHQRGLFYSQGHVHQHHKDPQLLL